jgi:anaerobic magnesium-protoporphyrin IX monomethyl ester cyclase
MFNKILLIRPENIYNYNNYPALNLILLGSALKAAGYEVKIINCAFENDPLRAIAEELPDTLFAGISLLTSEASDAYRIMKFIKEGSEVPVVVGGWHCTLFPEQMAECDYVDYVVCGEGDEHIVNIANCLKEGKKPDSKIFKKKAIDLEKLVEPDYSLDPSIERFITSYLTDKLSEVVYQPMRWLPYESSRGCPSQCTFCINVVTGNTLYRKKSAEKVLNEIERLVAKYRLTHLKIIDDNFFVDIERVRKICSGIIARGLKITWDGECRCDYFNERLLNDETLKLARKSGLVQLTLGIESGSAHTLGVMKKGIRPEQAEFAVKKCDEHGIIARSSFILEIPGERISDIKQTIRLINRLRKYPQFTCGVGTFRPYPKCELTTQLIQEGFLSEPKHFSEWTDKSIIDMYTSAEYIRPWQVNGRYSEAAAFYLNMESSVRLGNHQIDNPWDKTINSSFAFMGKARNRLMFYGLPFDKDIYKKFLVNFYDKRKNLEKCGSYPLSRNEGKK